jgi:hypothetical protein
MSVQREPISFAGSTLDQHRHVCAFFRSRDEEYDVLLPFFTEGLASGHKGVHIVDPDERAEHLARLNGAGIDVARAVEKGQLEVKGSDRHYLLDEHFDRERAIVQIKDTLDGGRAQGYPLTRLVARMRWALSGAPGVDDLLEYETRLNDVLPDFADPVVCVYDSSKFGAGIALDILRTHPMVILEGVLRVNPFYTPPDVFLRELRERDRRVGRA